MRRELLMPKLGLTMSEGVLVEWLVAPGRAFQQGESLFLIESEKSAVEVPAEADGRLLESSAAPGQTLPVGAVVGWWEDGVADADQAAPAGGAVPAPAVNRPGVSSPGVSTPGVNSSGVNTPGASTPALDTPAASTRVVATPLARRLARQRGVDLQGLAGSGPRGRIRAADVPPARSDAAPATQAALPAQPAAAGALQAPSATQATIARRLQQSKQLIPHFYLSVQAEVSALLSLRAELNAAQDAQRFTLNDFLLAAVGRALVALPQCNRVWTDEGVLSLSAADVGMAVDTPKGLLVPVLREAGRMPLGELSRTARSAIDSARAGRLSAGEMAGGAITVSNAGMHGLASMTSIINPGQSMILGVGAVQELFRPDAQGQPALRRELTLVLSADHRLHDGVSAAGLLQKVREGLSQPLALLVA